MVGYPSGMATFEDPRLTSHHEAGHVVAAHIVGRPARRVTMRGAWTDRNNTSMSECAINWAGPLAEHCYQPTTVAQRRALWQQQWRGDRRNLLRFDADARRLARWRADRIIHGRWPAVTAVAEALLRSGELTGADIAALVERAPTACLPDALSKMLPARPSWLDWEEPSGTARAHALVFV